MRLQGELNVPGAPGVRYKTNPGTGAPVSYIPSNQVQTGMIPGDPMSQIGNAGAFNVAHSLYNPASQFIPGTDSKEPHNLHHIDGGYGSFDPSTMNNRHNAPPGVRLDNTNVDRSGTPSDAGNQSSNLPTAIPQSSTAFPVGNVGYQIAQAQTGIGQPKQGEVKSNLLNPIDWFSGRNQETAGEVKEGTYKGGKGGSIDSMLRRTSDLNKLMNEM